MSTVGGRVNEVEGYKAVILLARTHIHKFTNDCFPSLLLSAGAIVNVAATATAAPVPSAVIATTAAYFSASVTTATIFKRF
jgi:hypothetical protein